MNASHFALPFRFENGTVATIEQDSEDDIAQSVRVLVTTQRGSRLEVPDYGIESAMGHQSNYPVTNEILSAVARWEPRASVDVSSSIDSVDEFIRTINVRVRPASVR